MRKGCLGLMIGGVYGWQQRMLKVRSCHLTWFVWHLLKSSWYNTHIPPPPVNIFVFTYDTILGWIFSERRDRHWLLHFSISGTESREGCHRTQGDNEKADGVSGPWLTLITSWFMKGCPDKWRIFFALVFIGIFFFVRKERVSIGKGALSAWRV
jgi:hypothetical protein